MGILDLTDVRELEDMVIKNIYNNLLSCKLDNKQQQLIVEYVASRDFKVEDAPKLFEHLKKWLAHVEGVEKDFENALKRVTADIEGSAKHRTKVIEKADAIHAEAIADAEAAKRQPRMQHPMMTLMSQLGMNMGQEDPEYGHGHGYGHH